MKKIFFTSLLIPFIFACQSPLNTNFLKNANDILVDTVADALAIEVKFETKRSWDAYKKYAWGHDVLMPLSKSYKDWYKEPLYISPIDAYSTLFLMGLKDEAKEIEIYVTDTLNFNKDLDAKVFEVNIRILGGLLAMFEWSENPEVLEKAKDFADRMMPAFNTPTGIPAYWVNLKTGVARGDTVNVAEAGTYLLEMGILSYYTKDPKYYQAAKKATLAIYNRRSEIGLIGDEIDVNTGKWVSVTSHICAGVDSYYEYLYKSYLLFGDKELGKIWNESLGLINKYLAEEHEDKLWYGRVDMNTGERSSSVITLYDAFFPAILALSGNMDRAVRLQNTWDWLWKKYGIEPMAYDYKKEKVTYPVYALNPEIIESAYYLYSMTNDSTYLQMNRHYWESIKKYCKTDVAFTSIENVETMVKRDNMPTFFFAETLKYFYLTFSNHQKNFRLQDYVLNTEAHPFKKSNFKKAEMKTRLGI